ncbi:GbsR/MarR family transcriptional regulator [Demequina globuliformis]|uniref:GbsR/MarR family transcriptional regulator n=1 Tax=Demequina globuliformis TaxID=676202 RepID=UPI000783E886|nr:MarR family transcriptional regulator [Demequina globuliformis]
MMSRADAAQPVGEGASRGPGGRGGAAAAARRDFVARVAAYWERGGLTHAAGTILGHLMVCEPADPTQAELADALGLSAGSVSTQLSQLQAIGMVERVRVPGERAAHYQLPRDMWTEILMSEQERIAGLRSLATAAEAVRPAERPDRIGSLDAMVRFWEQEWPGTQRRLDEFLRKERS